MRKISFKFRQWWRSWLSFLRVRRFEGVITNASEEDIANLSFKSSEEALEFLRKEFQWSDEEGQDHQDLSADSEVVVESIEADAVASDGSTPLTKANLSKIQIGMIWYEDNTVSFERLSDKKIKAIVELIEDGVVYGDLTASELQDIQENCLNWDDAKRYFENFSYPCKENEKIVWYEVEQLEKVCETYDVVRKTFKKIGKQFREGWFWSSTEYDFIYAWYVYFSSGGRDALNKYACCFYVRPVLALDLN